MATNDVVTPPTNGGDTLPTNGGDDTEYVCTLSDDLIRMAEEELNEKPEWRSRDIQALRDMLNKKTELKVRTDDAYLLRFLRAKKFDYDRAFNLIVRHYQMRADEKNKQLFSNLRPSTVKHVLDAGVTGVLPQRDKLGRRVIVFRPGKWDPSQYSIDDIFRANFLSLTKLVEEDKTQVTGVIMIIDLEHMGWIQATNVSPFYARKISSLLQEDESSHICGVMVLIDMHQVTIKHGKNISPLYAKRTSSILQEEESQICGIVLLADLKSMGWKQTRKLKPFYAKRVMSLLQDCFPMRFKGIHYVNEPSIFDYIFAIVRPFMKEKILSRIHFHGTRYHELTEYIDADYLPAEYGGTQPAFNNEEWKKTLLACDKEFEEEGKYGLVKPSAKPRPTPKDEALDCLAGSYRKMDM